MVPTKSKKRKSKKKRPTTLIFVHSNLDEAGLDPYEFRILAYVSCRGRGGCFARQSVIADNCRMSLRKVQGVLKSLCDKGYLVKEAKGVSVKQKRRTDEYRLAPNLLEKLEAKKNVPAQTNTSVELSVD